MAAVVETLAKAVPKGRSSTILFTQTFGELPADASQFERADVIRAQLQHITDPNLVLAILKACSARMQNIRANLGDAASSHGR